MTETTGHTHTHILTHAHTRARTYAHARAHTYAHIKNIGEIILYWHMTMLFSEALNPHEKKNQNNYWPSINGQKPIKK